MNFNSTLTTWMPPSYKQTAGTKVFSIPKKLEHSRGNKPLVKDRSRKSGSITERSLTKLAPDFAAW